MRSSGAGSDDNAAQPGTLVLVVGPSGAGKDSIMAGAKALLRDENRLVFARRLITRPADAGGEDHIEVSAADFATLRDCGGLLLHWEAHGLHYGLPGELAAARRAGAIVVANVSRSIIAEARRGLPPVAVILITAPAEVLATRLAARGRESAADIEQRLRREAAEDPADFVIENGGALSAAVERFAAILRGLPRQLASG